MIELGAFPSAFDGGGAVYQTAPEWLGTIPARRRYSSLCWRALASRPATDANHPDRTAAIRTAGDERRSALHAYLRALKRFGDFIIDGVVPDDLKGMTSPRLQANSRFTLK
jgi:hypothetical protein